MQNVKVSKDDLFRIGKAFYKSEDGNLIVQCTLDTVNLEVIILRSVLKEYGSKYKILYEDDFIGKKPNGEFYEGVDLVTNLPIKLVCPDCAEDDDLND